MMMMTDIFEPITCFFIANQSSAETFYASVKNWQT